MSEKQVKRDRQEERQQAAIPIATLTFNMMSDHNVSVSGPITNPVAIFDMLGRGILSLAAFYAERAQQTSQIVKADALTMQTLNQAAKKAGIILS